MLIENVIMIESDFKHEQFISDDKNFSVLANQNSIIEKVLMLTRFFKRDSELESDFSS